MILHRVGDGHEDAQGALDILLFGRSELDGGLRVTVVVVVAVCDDGADEIADAGGEGVHAVTAVPEVVVRGLIAEDEHESDND